MSEDCFICDCGETTAYFEVEKCRKCYRRHCLSCHKYLLGKYGKYIGCLQLQNCDKCADNADDESEEESEEESEAETEIIWRARCAYDSDGDDVYFKDKEDGKKYILDRMKVMLDDEQSYDKDGDLCFPYEFALQHYALH